MPPGESSPWNLPNALTMLRLVLVPVFGWLLLHDGGDDPTSRVAAFVVFVGATFTDYLDGALARRRGLVTTFGKIADPIADKALMGVALIGLSLLGELPWWVTVVILVREVGVTLLRFWVIRHGVISAGRGGKLKTVLQAAAVSLYLLPLTGFLATFRAWLMAAALVVTVVTGLHYVVKALRLRQTSERAVMKRAQRGLPT
ncbi:MAG TPA: CDP-diacylglycerol--glycerol-3-phosphate 3-phosphatidyltransferase [Candidatus Limnocylindria bacterium]|nr:CDP-diacylglycerol--glycerol-3-phosphate 3-phosphatidyltransferase [Candidatus Limnocylindria bacterium]